MVTTGVSDSSKISRLKKEVLSKIKLLYIAEAPNDIKTIEDYHLDVQIYYVNVKTELNKNIYIIQHLY